MGGGGDVVLKAVGVGSGGRGVGVGEAVTRVGDGVREGFGAGVVRIGAGVGKDVGDAVGVALGNRVGPSVYVGVSGSGLGEPRGVGERVTVGASMLAAGGSPGGPSTGLPGAWQPHINSPISASPTAMAARLSDPTTYPPPPPVCQSPRDPANPAAGSRGTVSGITSS